MKSYLSSHKNLRSRARIEILNYVLNFSIAKVSQESAARGSYQNAIISTESAFRITSDTEKEAVPGTLVVLSSAPSSKWYLSWVHGFKAEGYGGSFLLESIEDGALCWWSNISLYVFPKEKSDLFPSWRWTDAQFEVWDRWKRAGRRRDAYLTLPCPPEFTEDGGVILRTRRRLGLTNHAPEKKFPNWKKVKLSEMLAYYDEAVAANTTK